MASRKFFSLSYADPPYTKGSKISLGISAQHFLEPISDYNSESPPVYDINDTRQLYFFMCALGQGEYTGPTHQQIDLWLKLTLSAHTSPFTFDGLFFINDGRDYADGPAERPEFRIDGTGTITAQEDGVEVFDMAFKVVENTGIGIYAGICGSGGMNVTFPKHTRQEYGRSLVSEGIGTFRLDSTIEAGAFVV
ncbi:MAG: hypothetical protein Q9186_002956 [Xanthomendoza sp. 1 TL-2023]